MRVYQDFIGGTLTADPGETGVTLDSAEFAGLRTIAAPDFMAITIDEENVNGNGPEIVWVTAHTAASTSVTVTREQEGTNAPAAGHPIGTTWAAVLTEAALLERRRLQLNAQVGTTYTPVLADEQKLVTLANAGAITVTLPSDANLALSVGAQIHFAQIGAGQVTFVAGSGATVNGTPGLKCRAQWSVVTAIKRAANTWLLTGDLAA